MNLLFLILIILILLFIFGGFFGAIWVPTKRQNYERISTLTNLKPGNIFYDLGCGDASLLFYLSKKHNVKCVGIEISPILYSYSKIKSLFYKNVEIKFGNFSWYDLENADIIYVFLLPKIYNKLKNKIRKDAKENATIILSTWPFKDPKYSQISKREKDKTYYLYYKKSLL